MKGHFDNHCHTMYSNVSLSADSIIRPEQLLERAKALGLKGVAITDHAVISSHVKVLQYYLNKCKEDESWKDFTLGLGEEIYLCENGRSKETAQRGQRYPHCIVIAKDEIGHRQLRQISSKAWDRSFTLFVRRVPSWYSDLEEAIGDDKGHLIVTSACVGGILRDAFDNNKSETEAKEIIDWMKEWIGDDFYLEIAPAEYPEVIEYNKWIIELSQKYKIRLVFACDAHYLAKEDFQVHKAYLQSKDEERETESFYQYTYLQDDEEARKHMPYVSDELFAEMIENSHIMANSIETYDLFSPQLVPHLDDDRINNSVWKEQINECRVNPRYEYINKYVASESEDDKYFIYLVLNKLKELSLSKEKQEEYLERIEKECLEYWLTSERLGQTISSYILMVREIERIMWEEANSLVGIARGSAGSTLVNYLCGLTQMNPLEQGIYLPEWRFIHHSKVELPDVDVDSEASKKELIRAKLKEKAMRTGGDAVAICTFGTEGPRSAVLTAARSYGLTPDEGQYISSLIKQERGFSWSVTDCYYGNKDKDREPVQEFVEAMDKHPGLLEIVLGLEGLVSRSGIHACFTGDTKIAIPNGVKPIEELSIGDKVLTHKGNYRKIKDIIKTKKDVGLKLKGKGFFEDIKCTKEHPFYVLRNGKTEWISADEICPEDYIGIPIIREEKEIENCPIEISPSSLYWMGRFVGDGWIEERKRKGVQYDYDMALVLCCNKNNGEKEFLELLYNKLGFDYTVREYRTSYKFIMNGRTPLLDWMRRFGRGAYNKTIPDEILFLPKEKLYQFVKGYLSADGHVNKHGTSSYKTISPSLAFQMNRAFHKLENNYITNHIQSTSGEEIIEGRTVKAHKRYSGLMSKIKKGYKPILKYGYLWFKVDSKEEILFDNDVFNLEVEEDNTYVANGVVVHNCGINVLNHPIYYNNALMRAPNGTETTQFDLGDSDYMGGLKMDCLTVEALDKIHTCMDLLMQDGYIEWQGSLRETYNKYLHPDVLNRITPEMWKLIADNKLIDAFQMDSTVAKQSLAAIKPSTIPQLAQLNTLMRLMPEKGQKTPVEEYVEFKEHPEKLRDDIYKLNATDKEKKILYEFMKPYGGVLDSQESAMLAVMLPFTNYDVPHANKIRKIIA